MKQILKQKPKPEPEVECPICGKTITGQTKTQAKNNLKNHKVTHGKHNRLKNRIPRKNGYRCEKNEIKQFIRNQAREILSKHSKASASVLAKKIRRKILERDVVTTHDLDQITEQKVGLNLYHCDDFEKKGNYTWRLKNGA